MHLNQDLKNPAWFLLFIHCRPESLIIVEIRNSPSNPQSAFIRAVGESVSVICIIVEVSAIRSKKLRGCLHNGLVGQKSVGRVSLSLKEIDRGRDVYNHLK